MKALKKCIGLLSLLLAFMLCFTGCKNRFEGSGSKEAASAEQLALKLDDPWKASIPIRREQLDGNYSDGVYSGEGYGMEGWIRISITIQSNRLIVNSIQQEGETQSVGGYEGIRDGIYAQQIEATQGTDIDGISGATLTTHGVVSALKAALEQASEKTVLSLLKDGTYTGESKGVGGWVKVTISVSDGKITAVSVEQEGETVGYGGYEAIANGTFASQIQAAQETAIDGISGATITTNAVKEALSKALKQAN